MHSGTKVRSTSSWLKFGAGIGGAISGVYTYSKLKETQTFKSLMSPFSTAKMETVKIPITP